MAPDSPPPAADPPAPLVSVVLETDSVHDYDDITLEDCLRALARQDYPRDRIELIAVDGGKAPRLAALARATFPDAVVLECPGGTKFEQKNLAITVARGEFVALADADCAPPPDWVSTAARALAAGPPDVAGVQGMTTVSSGVLSREITALFYGIRQGHGGDAARLVTDNCAFRTAVIRRFGFEHAGFSTVVDSLLLRRLRRAGYRVRLERRLRMVHSYPRPSRVTAAWFFARAWTVGYDMVRVRQREPDMPGARLVRGAGGLGWPLLVLAKLWRDGAQVWHHRGPLGARVLPALPLLLVYEAILLLGGLGALLRLPPPRVS